MKVSKFLEILNNELAAYKDCSIDDWESIPQGQRISLYKILQDTIANNSDLRIKYRWDYDD